MEKTLFFLLMFTFAGCSLVESGQDELNGTWEWIHTYGGIAGQTLTPESEGYQQQLIFYGGRSYLLARGGKTIRKGSYNLTDAKMGGQMRPAIEFESDHWETFYEILNDTLFLSPNCRDCFFDTYVRKR